MRKGAILSLLLLLGCAPEAECDFDGNAALEHVRMLVSHGQRVSGSAEIVKSAEYIIGALPDTVKKRTIEFEDVTPDGLKKFRNIEAVIPAENPDSGEKFIIVSGHYDLKKLDPPMDGANDSGSSAALLIELAKTVKSPRCEVRIVWFDGEECLSGRYSEADGLHGSRNYAAGLSPDELKNCIALVNVDMIGDRDLKYTLSADTSLEMVEKVIKAAEKSGNSGLITQHRGNILDDDQPFRQRGIPCVNLIDFDYAAWHTPRDDISQVSAASLAATGNLVIALLDELQK